MTSGGLMRNGPVWQGRSPLPPDSDCAQPPPGAPGSHSQQAAGARPQADPLKPRAAPEHGCAPHPSCFPQQPKNPPEKVLQLLELLESWPTHRYTMAWWVHAVAPEYGRASDTSSALSRALLSSQERGSDNLIDRVPSQQPLYLLKNDVSDVLVNSILGGPLVQNTHF